MKKVIITMVLAMSFVMGNECTDAVQNVSSIIQDLESAKMYNDTEYIEYYSRELNDANEIMEYTCENQDEYLDNEQTI